MPTYDYRCDACGHTFEKSHSIKADPIRKCPQCKKLAVKIVIGGGSGILFKGSGFYQTDYRSKSYNEAKNKDNPPAAPAPAKDTKALRNNK